MSEYVSAIRSEIRWLWSVWRVRRFATRDDLLHSRRQAFLNELRPRVPGGRIAYPDAWLQVTPEDVDRALRATREDRPTLLSRLVKLEVIASIRLRCRRVLAALLERPAQLRSHGA